MKFVIIFSLLTVGWCIPYKLMEIDERDFKIMQDVDDDTNVISGFYSWLSPEGGRQFFVRYVADRNGYRVLDSNVVPVSLSGVRVDGNQGSFRTMSMDHSQESNEQDKTNEGVDYDSKHAKPSVEDLHSVEDNDSKHDKPSVEDPHSVEDSDSKHDKPSVEDSHSHEHNTHSVEDQDIPSLENTEENKSEEDSLESLINEDDDTLFNKLYAIFL